MKTLRTRTPIVALVLSAAAVCLNGCAVLAGAAAGGAAAYVVDHELDHRHHHDH